VKGLNGESSELPSRGLCLPNTNGFQTESMEQMQKPLVTGTSQNIQHSRVLHLQAYTDATDLGVNKHHRKKNLTIVLSIHCKFEIAKI